MISNPTDVTQHLDKGTGISNAYLAVLEPDTSPGDSDIESLDYFTREDDLTVQLVNQSVVLRGQGLKWKLSYNMDQDDLSPEDRQKLHTMLLDLHQA